MIGLAETYMLANAATQTLFRTNPMQFLLGSPGRNYAADGTSAMSLKELFRANQHSSGSSQFDTGAIIRRNLNANWFNGAMQMVFIPIGFKLGRGLAKPAISRGNRLLGKAGIANTVKL